MCCMSSLSSSRTLSRLTRMRIELELEKEEAAAKMRKHPYPYPLRLKERFHYLQSRLEALDFTYDTALRSFYQFNNK